MNENNHLLIEYPDFVEELNKKVKCKNLGEKFAFINSFIFDYLKEYHIPSAFIKPQNKNSLLFYKYSKFPFSVRVMNHADKKIARIFSVKEHTPLNIPIFEYHYGALRDNCISENHLISFDVCSNEDIKLINRTCSKINAVLKSFFERRNANLIELTCHFGKSEDRIWTVDDFTPRSLKVIPVNNDSDIDPYKFSTSNEIKKYSDYLYNLMSV